VFFVEQRLQMLSLSSRDRTCSSQNASYDFGNSIFKTQLTIDPFRVDGGVRIDRVKDDESKLGMGVVPVSI